MLTQVVQRVFNVPEHPVGTVLYRFIKMENDSVLVHCQLPSFGWRRDGGCSRLLKHDSAMPPNVRHQPQRADVNRAVGCMPCWADNSDPVSRRDNGGEVGFTGGGVPKVLEYRIESRERQQVRGRDLDADRLI